MISLFIVIYFDKKKIIFVFWKFILFFFALKYIILNQIFKLGFYLVNFHLFRKTDGQIFEN
jgi:hypothetical protein